MDARILEGKQRRTARLEFVHETGARVRKEDPPQRIGCECDRRIELSGAVALVAPCAEEFERGQLQGHGRGVRAILTRSSEQSRKEDGEQEWPSLLVEMEFAHVREIQVQKLSDIILGNIITHLSKRHSAGCGRVK